MPRDMFGDVVDPSIKLGSQKWYTVPLSIVALEETDARELVVPLLLMPLLVPVVIAAAKASAPLLSDPAHAEHLGRWLLMLTFYDLAFVLVSLGVFDYLLED